MASPKELRSAALGNKVVENLQKRGMEGYYCPTSKDAIEKVLELIPEGSSISWGGSETIRSMGLTAKIKEGNYKGLSIISEEQVIKAAETLLLESK